MLMPYLGALEAWLYAPIVALFGTGPHALRLPTLALGAATIALFAWLTKRWAGPQAARLTAWLLATDPTYLWTARCDWGPVTLQRFLSVAGCALVWSWWRSGRQSHLFYGFALFGLGVFDKLTFQWVLLAYAFAVAVTLRRQVLEKLRPAAGGVALAGLLLGAAPYLAYRLQAPTPGLDLAIETEPGRYLQKWGMLLQALDGTVARGFMLASTAPQPGPSRGLLDDALEAAFGPELSQGTAGSLLPWALLAALAALPWTRDPSTRFAAAFSPAGVLLMAPVRDAGAVHHISLLWPYPQLLVGASLAWWAARRRRLSQGLFAVFVASNLVTIASLYRDAARLGGGPHWSEAAYALADDLRHRNPRFAVSLDWGVDNPQRFLLAHDPPVQPLAFPWDWADRGTVEKLQAELRAGGVVFVGRADGADSLYPETRDSARTAAAEAGFRLDLARVIHDRQGRAVFHVLEPRPLE